MAESKIEWTERSWNPLAGCSILTPGCTNCYAMKMAARLEAMGQELYRGLTKPSKAGPVWRGTIRVNREGLLAPLKRKKPTTYFVNSMSDLFFELASDELIDEIFAVMALCPQHTFQVLTKRAQRMHDYMGHYRFNRVLDARGRVAGSWDSTISYDWPPRNVWLGVSTERQQEADERIPLLLQTPAAVRFISAEPLLGPIRLHNIAGRTDPMPPHHDHFDALHPFQPGGRLDWVIVGGESGPGARACWTPNVRKIVGDCLDAEVPVFVKQLGSHVRDRGDVGFDGCGPREWHLADRDQVETDPDGFLDPAQDAAVRIHLKDRKGGDMAEWPEDLRVRQMPRINAPTEVAA